MHDRYKAAFFLIIFIFAIAIIERVEAGFFDRLTTVKLTKLDVYFIVATIGTAAIIGIATGAILQTSSQINYIAKITILTMITVAVSFAIWVDSDKNSALVFASIGAVIIGWIHQSHRTASLQRRQHTLTVLFEMRQCPHFIEAHRILSHYHPPGTRLTKTEAGKLVAAWKDPKSYKPKSPSDHADTIGDRVRALIFVLNYYEFLAAGVDVEDIDASLLLKSHGGPMEQTYLRFIAFIRQLWGNRPIPSDENEPFYYLFLLIEDTWKNNIPDPPD